MLVEAQQGSAQRLPEVNQNERADFPVMPRLEVRPLASRGGLLGFKASSLSTAPC